MSNPPPIGISADYQAFCAAEIAENEKRISVYSGESSDLGIRAEHFLPDHSLKLLKESLSANLVSMYLGEYSDITASMRAVAIAELPRKAFYDHAQQEAQRDIVLLKKELARRNALSSELVGFLSDETQQKLEELAATAEDTKSTINDRMQANMGRVSEVTSRDIVQAFMGGRSGVDPFGVTNSLPYKITEFDKSRFSGLESRLHCPCCGKLNATEEFLEAFTALESAWGKSLSITSGYRCPQHNAAVGGARGSKHLEGIAADIRVRNIEERNELESVARSVGFTGFGRANTFLHIDVGPTRSWAYGPAGNAISRRA